jgi:hypothetical protein
LREWNLSRAFEIYVNGQRLMASGRVAPFVPYTSNARVLRRIPKYILATGSVLIAVRVHISGSEWVNGQDPGFFATNLTLGQESALYQDDWLAIIGQNALNWLDDLLQIGLGFVALVLFAAHRRQFEYLWVFAVGALRIAESPVPVISLFHNIPAAWEVLEDLLRIATPYLWVSMYFAFVHQRIGRRWRALLIFAGVLNALSSVQGLFFASPLPFQLICNLPYIILLSVVIPVVLAMHLRRGNREAGILLIPVILFSLYIYAEFAFVALFEFSAWRSLALKGLDLIDRYPAGPFVLSLNNLSGILSTLSLAIIMLLRSANMSRRQAFMESELAAAQQVQQVLLPEHIETVPGFTVESVYQPAQQVGGDFFQILSAEYGSLLVVVGDVAGKGLPAAMLVSVLVGAIRGAAEYFKSPAELLANLNERLIGRVQGGFSTAMVALISSEGWVTVANAGHLAPYLDGVEVALPGALPLGVVSGVTYETTKFHLLRGSRLTFYSDGVIEAQNQKGELFGFDRGRAISTQSAAAIVEAATLFGQSDDITVVAIARTPAIATAA